MNTNREEIEQEILARWYADGAEATLRRVIDRMAAAEAQMQALLAACELALTYIEDGAPQTAALRLRAALAHVETRIVGSDMPAIVLAGAGEKRERQC